MTAIHRIKFLKRANNEFQNLSKTSKRKATIYKSIDLLIKLVISFGGALITYFSDPNVQVSSIQIIRAFGIIIAGLTALSSVFMFEKRCLSNMQVHTKCKSVINDIEEHIDKIQENPSQSTGIDTEDYIKNIFKELSSLSLASFTDSTYGKITSKRDLDI